MTESTELRIEPVSGPPRSLHQPVGWAYIHTIRRGTRRRWLFMSAQVGHNSDPQD